MNSRFQVALAVMIVLVIVSKAPAYVHVNFKATVGGTWVTPGSGFSWSGDNGTHLTITNSAAGYWRIWADDPSSENVLSITVSGGSNDVTVLVGKAEDDSDPTAELSALTRSAVAGCHNLGPITQSSATVRVKARITGDLGTDSSNTAVNVYQIIRLDVGGDIKRPTFSHLSTTAVCEAIIAGGAITDEDSTGPTVIKGSITSAGGKIKLIQAYGDIACPIFVDNDGEVTMIVSTHGDVGFARPYDSAASSAYQGTKIEAGTIGTIRGETIRSNISATVGVKNIESTEYGIRGNLTTPKLLNQSLFEGGVIKAKDSCNMNMTFEDELPANASILIGSYFGYDTSTGSGTLPSQPTIACTSASGLKGQIILNAAQPSYPFSSFGMSIRRPFLGNVKVGTGGSQVTLAYPNTYAATDSSVGGGSVSVVGYNLHLESCDPPYSRSLGNFPEFTTCPTITLRWYGPLEAPSGVPLWITYTDGSSLVEVTSSFTISMDSSDPRQIIVTPNAPEELAPGMYWVSPNASTEYSYDYPYSHLYCRNSELGANANVPVAEDIYIFEITSGLLRSGGGDSMTSGGSASSPCIADADCDGSITTLDITGFLELYFTANTTSATTECPGRTADANGDSAVDAADIAAFLSAWFARCT